VRAGSSPEVVCLIGIGRDTRNPCSLKGDPFGDRGEFSQCRIRHERRRWQQRPVYDENRRAESGDDHRKKRKARPQPNSATLNTRDPFGNPRSHFGVRNVAVPALESFAWTSKTKSGSRFGMDQTNSGCERFVADFIGMLPVEEPL
jgi:hypothetical protein